MAENANRSVVVTGGSGGIGRDISLRLGRDGFSVAVVYSGNADKAQEIVNEIKSAGGKAVAIKADVANPADVENLFKQAITALGPLTAVVHTAGIMPLSPISNLDVDAFDKVIATNLRGSFLVMGHAAKNLTDGGRIVVFSSSVLAKSFPGYGAYIASKSGVEGLVRVLANELRGKGITVNAIAPGPTGTPLFLNGKSQATIEEFRKLSPLERIGTPEEIANAVSFIVGADGSWVNAQVLRVNGGFA